ncbi:MAG TPA: hypothetical protein PKW95_19915 [bacterium]|nr:hypothetical protein [bacterium]
MRLMRILTVLALLLVLAGCLDNEIRVRLLPDGSGTYFEAVEIPQDLIDLVMDQRGISDIKDLMALALIKAEEELKNTPDVRIVHAEAYCVERVCRMGLTFSFTSTQAWNAFAGSSRYPQFSLTTQAPTGKTNTEPTVRWTVTVDMAGRELPGMGEEGGEQPMLGGQENQGQVKIIIEGPREAERENFGEPVEGATINRTVDGAVEYVGKMDLMTRPTKMIGRFAGLPFSAPELSKRREILAPEPTPEYKKILAVVERLKESEHLKAAAQAAIVDSTFLLHLTVNEDGTIGITQGRMFRGAAGELMAEREALLHYLLPEVNANYNCTISRTTKFGNGNTTVFERKRRQPLPAGAFGELISVRRDNDELVYSFAVGPLLTFGALEEAPEQPLGMLIVSMPRAVSGTNGEKMNDRTVEMEFTADHLAGPSMLIVRIPAAK